MWGYNFTGIATDAPEPATEAPSAKIAQPQPPEVASANALANKENPLVTVQPDSADVIDQLAPLPDDSEETSQANAAESLLNAERSKNSKPQTNVAVIDDAPKGNPNAAGIAALSELQQNQNNSNHDMIGFPTRNLAAAAAATINAPASVTVTPTPSAGLDTALVGGQARGYSMLYLMHPKARPVVEAQIQNLIDANIKQVYISVLVDGTFQKDHAYLQSILQRLNDAGKEITLEQYLASGPTMRLYDKTKIKTVFSQIEPIHFRSFSLYQTKMQSDIQTIAKEARTSFDKNSSLNAANVNMVSIMLEDNLESVSYRYMRNLVAQSIGNSATFIRSACPTNCYEGNDEQSWGDALELHKLQEFSQLHEGDGYTLDGVDVTYPGDQNSGDIEIDQVRAMLRDSYGKGNRFFGLWRKGYQGLQGGDQTQSPDDRTYLVPSASDLQIERSLLREGLVSNSGG